MGNPPRDPDGEVIPYDDPAIEDGDGLVRYIHPTLFIYNENLGRRILTSGAFKSSKGPIGGMSVDLERQMNEAGLDSLARLRHPDHGAVRLIAGDVRKLGHQVGASPTPDNPFHGEVWVVGTSRKALRKIRDCAIWIKKPAVQD